MLFGDKKYSLLPKIDIDDIKQVVTEDVYPNLYKLLQIAFTIPVSCATCNILQFGD